MALTPDSEVIAALLPLLAGAGDAAPPAIGDVHGRRVNGEGMFAALSAQIPPTPGVTYTSHQIEVDGGSIEVRHYSREGSQPGSAIVYIHGGGMIFGSLDAYDGFVRSYVHESGVPFFAMEYRLAPEFPDPVPVEDSYAALVWVHDHAAEFGIDPARIAVMGDSAGGGLAAGVALMARDRSGPALASQILIYPMLDHRNLTPDLEIGELLTWTYNDNITGWAALLGEGHEDRDVSPYASPTHAESVAGLPRTYLEVGQLDIFRDEDIAYALRLSRAGVDTELHLHPGAPHAFEAFASASAVGRRSRADRIRFITEV